jgi:hypothetical protein
MTFIAETGGVLSEAGIVAETTVDVESDVNLDVPSGTGGTIDAGDRGIDSGESVDGATIDGVPALLAVDKTSVDFGRIVVGTTSPAAEILLTHRGPGRVAGVTVTPSATSHVRLTTYGCKGALPEGATCTISIIAEAVHAGSFTGSITIADDSGSSAPVTISVEGEVLPTDYGVIWIEPSGAAFAVNAGGTSPAVTFGVPGSQVAASFKLSFSSGSGSDFHVVDNGCSNVPANTRCSFSVTFSPLTKEAGARAEMLIVSGTGALSDYTGFVMLSGTVWPESPFALTPAVADFGSVAYGTTGPATVLTVANHGDIDSSPLTVSVSGNSFAISQDNCTGRTIAKNMSCTFATAFKPTGMGPTSAILKVNDSREELPVVQMLVGQGI